MSDTAPGSPGWYDDPDGRRRWWDGQRWGAYAPWDDRGGPERPTAPERPRLDRSLTFDPTAAGRVARAQPSAPSAPGAPIGSRGFLPAGAGDAGSRGTGSAGSGSAGSGSAGSGSAGSGSAGSGSAGSGSAASRAARARAARGARPAKRMALAYALAIVLGLLGAHRFYLGRVPSGTVQMMLSFAAAAAVVVWQGGGDAPLWLLAVPAAAAIWWIADLFRVAEMVRAINRRAAMQPGAPGSERGWPDP